MYYHGSTSLDGGRGTIHGSAGGRRRRERKKPIFIVCCSYSGRDLRDFGQQIGGVVRRDEGSTSPNGDEGAGRDL